MWRISLATLILTQICLGAPPLVEEGDKGRTIKEAALLGVEVVKTTGEIYAAGLDAVGVGIEKLTNSTEDGLQSLNNATVDVSDAVLQMFDNKIEFILCRIFRICGKFKKPADEKPADDKPADDKPAGAPRLNLEPELTIEEINAAILDLARDEPVSGRLLWVFNQDYQTYLTQRVEKILCDWGSTQFCRAQDNTDTTTVAPGDETTLAPEDAPATNAPRFLWPSKKSKKPVKVVKQKNPTITASYAVRRLFSYLTVRVGFVACKLRVWCPDEFKGFIPDPVVAEGTDTTVVPEMTTNAP